MSTLFLGLLAALSSCRPPSPPLSTSPLESGDLLELRVRDAQRPSARFVHTLRVAEDGTVRPPLAAPVPAAGTPPARLADEILRRYQADGLVWRGEASVRVLRRPGRVPAIRPGDVLSVTLVTTNALVVDAHEIRKLTRVAADGTHRAPWVGPVHVADLTERQASDAVRARLRAASLTDDTDAVVLRLPSGDPFALGNGAVHPGDRVRVGVRDLFEPNQEAAMILRIARDGSVQVPVLGRVDAAGLTEPAAEARIVERLRAANLIEVPVVSLLRFRR